jgi:hypothetical protein
MAQSTHRRLKGEGAAGVERRFLTILHGQTNTTVHDREVLIRVHDELLHIFGLCEAPH